MDIVAQCLMFYCKLKPKCFIFKSVFVKRRTSQRKKGKTVEGNEEAECLVKINASMVNKRLTEPKLLYISV